MAIAAAPTRRPGQQPSRGWNADLGRHVFGVAAAFLGIVGLVWGDFATVWQPVPREIPGYVLLAHLSALLLLCCGAGIQLPRTARAAAYALAILSLAFALPWMVRVARFPELSGTWGGCAEQLSIAIAAVAVARRGYAGSKSACRIAFGACAVAFGLNHLFALPQTAAMVPAWVAPGPMFWAVATGVFHLAAGVALIYGAMALLAARLLTLMMIGFGLFVWAPPLLAGSTNHVIWAGNAMNLLMAGAAWIIADAIARTPARASARSAPGGTEGGGDH